MRNVKIESLCLAMIAAQSIIFWLSQSFILGNKILPFGTFVAPAILGFIVGIFGLGVIAKELLNRQPLRLQLLLPSGMCIACFAFYQVNLGWQNLDFRRGNDYSTDIINVPKYTISREHRLNFGETKFWTLFEVFDKTLKADANSVTVPMSGLDTNRLIRKMALQSGWIGIRHKVLASDSTGLIETFEFKAGLLLLRQRSDVVIRVVSRQNYSAVIDIRSSSPTKRVDLGLNNMLINKITAKVLEMADDFGVSANNVAHAANL